MKMQVLVIFCLPHTYCDLTKFLMMFLFYFENSKINFCFYSSFKYERAFWLIIILSNYCNRQMTVIILAFAFRRLIANWNEKINFLILSSLLATHTRSINHNFNT